MTPTWQSDCGRVVLYHADCLAVLPGLAGIDAVVTDPPYGLAKRWTGGTWGAAPVWRAAREWDGAGAPIATMHAVIGKAPICVVWGGNYYPMAPSRCWLAWVKSNSVPTMADMELAWTNLDAPSRTMVYKVNTQGERLHAAQKPVPVMAWCMDAVRCDLGACVCDPFMGSGTTGVACLRTGRRFVGIEIDAHYYEVAKARLQREMAQPMLLPPEPAARPTQPALLEVTP